MLACGSTKPPAAAPSAVPAPASHESGRLWKTKLDVDHALVGKIWDVAHGSFVTSAQLAERAAAARFVLLGEKHDNPDHHALQAEQIAELVARGRKPAVVLEMLEQPQQPQVDAYLQQAGASAAGFGTALGWEKSMWPPYAEYQPIFDVALGGKLAIIAGNLAHADAKALVKQGVSALPPERLQALRLDQPFPEALESSLVQELRDSHCGHLPENLLAPMALAQHARDAQMAKSLLAAGGDGAVLIAGGGHARRDRGVPYYLALEAPGASVLSVVFREVGHDQTEPKSYVADEGPFDFVWFTPRASDEDPCAAFAK